MNNTTQERITKHFNGLTFSLLGAIVYLDNEIMLGGISHYSVHSCLRLEQPLAFGRYLELRVDDVPLGVDFGLDGVLFSLVERDKVLGNLRSKPAFICTLKSTMEAANISTKLDMDRLYERYEEEYNND